MEKVHNFLDPPSPRKVWTFLKLGKLGIFEPPPQIWNISLKHLKLPKNHFKTNLFFLQLKYIKCAFEFGKNLKFDDTPPPFT